MNINPIQLINDLLTKQYHEYKEEDNFGASIVRFKIEDGKLKSAMENRCDFCDEVEAVNFEVDLKGDLNINTLNLAVVDLNQKINEYFEKDIEEELKKLK